MTKPENNTPPEQDGEQARKEFFEWVARWHRTEFAKTIYYAISQMAKHRRRGHPGKPAADVFRIVTTVALLEKCGETEARAKKLAAERFHINLRSVQSYFKASGDFVREMVEARGMVPSGDGSPFRLTLDEMRKLKRHFFSRKEIAHLNS